ncbi:MAG: type II toxin-antitoxin system HicB family antitoxin [Thaumarchaeota archaeon]|mgnify:CR=1 FL=1|nr:type II toxin-antitoxin system HicB family antitoxin [Nitrososphaerota archaeon]
MGRVFHALVERDEEGWFTVRCIELPAAISQGRTMEEALKNLREAIELVLEELGDQTGQRKVVEVEVSV